MDFEARRENLEDRKKELARDYADYHRLYKEAIEFTTKLLEECADAGITRVAIAEQHEKVPESKKYTFNIMKSLFIYKPRYTVKGEETIDSITTRLGINRGYKGSQRMINTDKLIDGVYTFRKDTWRKIY